MIQDLSSYIGTLSNASTEATNMLIRGNLSSMADIINRANLAIFNNMTSYPSLPVENQQGAGMNDLQSDFISDRVSDGLRHATIEMSSDDRESLVDVARNAINGTPSFQA